MSSSMLTGVVALPYLHNTGAAIFVASLLSRVITIIQKLASMSQVRPHGPVYQFVVLWQ